MRRIRGTGGIAAAITFVVGLAIATMVIDHQEPEGTENISTDDVVARFAIRQYREKAEEICEWVSEDWSMFTREEMVTMVLPHFFYGMPEDTEQHIRNLINRDCPERG